MTAQRSRRAVATHLLADLSRDARALVEAPAGAGLERGLHDHLHGQISAASRVLRTTRTGIPLHAGACKLPDGPGLLIAGHTRSGKSTLVGLLGRSRGAAIVSDDTVWVIGGSASSIGAPAAIRKDSPLWEFAREQWYADDSSRLLVRLADLATGGTRDTAPIDVIVFPSFTADAPPSTVVLSAGDTFCRLAASILRTCADEETLAIAQLAATRCAVSLTFGDPETALERIDEVVTARLLPVSAEVAWLDRDKLRAAGLRAGVTGLRFGEDSVLWHRSLGRVAHVRGWAADSMCDHALAAQLQPLGLAARRTSTDATVR